MDSNKIIVSICCITYNHASYIRQCLDGFLMQKTTFPIEILIHDDASTDGTQNIIREYEVKYPEIVKPIYQKENQYSKGVKIGLTYNFSRAQGKYIALCEGDDYWTDPLKLQQQVDFLETHSEYSSCFHRYKVFCEEGKYFEDTIYPLNIPEEGITFDLNDYMNGNWITHPLTAMFRSVLVDTIKKTSSFKDLALFYFLLKSGPGFVDSGCYAVYRVHGGGIYSGVSYAAKILGDIKTINGICIADKTLLSVRWMKVKLEQCMGEVGFSFMWENRKVLKTSFDILSDYYDVWSLRKIFFRNVHLGRKIMNYIKR